MSDRGVFRGRLFGPGLPGGGVDAGGAWSGGEIRVTAADAPETLGSSPVVTAGGFNGTSLRLSWETPAGSFTLVLDDDGEIARCHDTAPPGLRPSIAAARSSRHRVDRRFRRGWILLVLAALLLSAATLRLITDSDRFARWVVDRIPVEQESRLGDLVIAQSRLQFPLTETGKEIGVIREIGARLTPGTRYRYRWFIAERPDVNAFAAPGGVVVVFRGLLDRVGSPEELAGVLAHEIAHAEHRHTLMVTVKSLGVRGIISLLTGDLSGGGVGDLSARLISLRFSRDAEREADDEGLRRLIQARIDPRGMIRFYETIERKGGGAPPPILSTHPATGERLQRLRQEVARHPGPWDPLPREWGDALRGR